MYRIKLIEPWVDPKTKKHYKAGEIITVNESQYRRPLSYGLRYVVVPIKSTDPGTLPKKKKAEDKKKFEPKSFENQEKSDNEFTDLNNSMEALDNEL